MAITDLTNTSLTGTTWVFNNTLLASPYTGYTKTIHVDITCNNVSYDTMLLMFSYGLEPSIVTSVYVQNEGESGSVIQIYNDSTGSVDDGWVNDNYKTITFTGGEDIADSDFVSWVQQNASIKVYDVVVTYNNSVSICLDDTGTAILDTEGTYLTDDITIEYTKPSAITVLPLSVTSNGTYTASSGTAYSPVAVNVSGGTDTVVDFIENHGTLSSFEHSTITTIGGGAFFFCSKLTTVNFPSCKSIGFNAFSSCTRLTTISFPICETIGSYAFYYCSSLTTASFPACTLVSNNAFYSCRNLTTANFPVCSSVGSNAFYYCSSLTTANFPSCTSIGNYAFFSCRTLTTASFSLCRSIENNAFNNCSSLSEANFPSCTYISTGAFSSCGNLSNISFPVCKTIAQYAFYSCKALTTASFPKCSTIGSSAFRNCYNLLSLYLLGSSIVSIPTSTVFANTPIAGYTTSTGGVYGSIYVPSSLYSSYKTYTNWAYFSSRFVSV